MNRSRQQENGMEVEEQVISIGQNIVKRKGRRQNINEDMGSPSTNSFERNVSLSNILFVSDTSVGGRGGN